MRSAGLSWRESVHKMKQNPPCVCHIVDALNPGGLERTLIAIALGTRGFVHHVWCLKDKGFLSRELEHAGVPVREFGFAGGLTLFGLMRLAGALKRERFDIVHCHGLFPSIWGRPAALLARVPARVVHCQNVYYGISWKERFKLRLLVGMTTRFIAVSEAVKECLVSFVGIPASKVQIIYNSAPSVTISEENRARIRREFGCAADDVLVCSAGRLCAHKGHRFLIEAVARMKDSLRVKLVIVGDGDQRDDLRQRIRVLPEGQAYLAGYRADCAQIIASSDIYVQPSLQREGLPLVLAEAAAAGCALIATRVGGNPEIVSDGVNGFLVPQADSEALSRALAVLGTDACLRKKMGSESCTIWERFFTRDAMCGSMRVLYESLIGG
jgi:glycosyltransferase involved in cell wall biosynthesis